MDPQRIAADPAISAFVTANAGSGKTKTLIDRVARLLLAGASPEAILCVTYTKAAAAEMQRRLFERLGEWCVTPDVKLREQLGALEGRDPAEFDHRELSKARGLFAKRAGDAGRAEDPDHPRLLREAAAAFPAGGRGLARLPGDGRQRLRRHRPRRAAGRWRPMSPTMTTPSPRPMPGSRWRWTSPASRRCSPPSRASAERIGEYLERGRRPGGRGRGCLEGLRLPLWTQQRRGRHGRGHGANWTATSGARPPTCC